MKKLALAALAAFSLMALGCPPENAKKDGHEHKPGEKHTDGDDKKKGAHEHKPGEKHTEGDEHKPGDGHDHGNDE